MATLSLTQGLELLDQRTRFVRITLYIYIAVSLADIAVVAGELAGLVDTEAVELDLLGGLAALVYLLFALAMLTAIVLVSLWIYRAHANLRAAEVDGLEFTPGWAVGWYFIPFANLIKPFQAMRELWNVSLVQDGGYGQEADPQLKVWWGCWIAGNILSNIGLRMQGLEGGGGMPIGYGLDIVSTALLIAAAWFLLRIVETINAAQRSGTTLAHAFA